VQEGGRAEEKREGGGGLWMIAGWAATKCLLAMHEGEGL
jgi:hypothetical protein